MPIYFYTAKSFKGETKSGSMEIEDEKNLARTLRQEGYILVRAENQDSKKKNRVSLGIPSFLKKISLTDKIFFTRNLQIMISAGMSLPRALRILAEQSENKKFSKAVSDIENNVTKGKSFSEALSQHADIFPDLFINMIRVGEESGTMEKVLKNLTYQMEREKDLITKVRGAMTYPMVILIFMILVGIVMMVAVVPKLAAVFTEMEVELPFTTRVILGLGGFLEKNLIFLVAIVAILIILFRLALKNKEVKKLINYLSLKAPIISPIMKKINTAVTARTLGSLVDAGVPIVKSLEIVSGTMTNFYYKEAIKKAAQEVQKGKKLSESLLPYQNIYPSIMIQMMAIGEETGETSTILAKIADFYEEEVSNITKNLSSIIEPVLMVIIGIAVGFFAVSMIQPMYSMMGQIE